MTSQNRPEGHEGKNGDRVLLGAQIAHQIRRHILDHGLVEGAELASEGRLADEYEVSQRVIRDALRLLSQQGVIRTHQGKRATVSTLRPVAIQRYFETVLDADAAAASELVDLRLALETRAAASAAEHASEEDIAELRRLADQLASLGEAESEKRSRLDLDFHTHIMRIAQNRFFLAVTEALHDVLDDNFSAGHRMTERSGGTHGRSNDEHVALVDAIAAHDPQRAEALMQAHLERVRSTFQQPAATP